MTNIDYYVVVRDINSAKKTIEVFDESRDFDDWYQEHESEVEIIEKGISLLKAMELARDD